MPANWDDIDLSDAVIRAVANAIRTHLPSEEPEFSDSDDAEDIALSLLSPTGDYEVWDENQEAAKLADLRRTARRLTTIYRDIHPTIQEFLGHVSYGMKVGDYRTRDPIPGLDIISALPELADRSIKAAQLRLRSGGTKARTDWLSVSVVDACRIVWSRRRKGSEAPWTVNDSAPFALFLGEVFSAFCIDASPRAAVDAWNRVQSYDENT